MFALSKYTKWIFAPAGTRATPREQVLKISKVCRARWSGRAEGAYDVELSFWHKENDMFEKLS